MMQTRPGGSLIEVLPADEAEPLLQFDTVVAQGELPGSNVQEIAFSPDEDPVVEDEPLPSVTFDMDDPQLALRMRAELEAVYALGGRRGWTEFGAALGGMVRINNGMREPVPVQGEYVYRDEKQSPNRHRLLALFNEQILLVDGAIDEAQQAVRRRAAVFGLARLQESRDLVLSEAVRYLGSEGVAKEALSTGKPAAHISGPDAAALVRAFLRVGELRRELEPIVSGVEREQRSYAQRRALEQQRIEQDLGADFESLGQAEQSRRSVAAIEASRVRNPTTGEPESLKASRLVLAEKQAEVANRLAILCRQFPVLFRVWNTVTVQLVEEYVRRYSSYPLTYVATRLSSDFAYRDAIVGALHRTWSAAGTLQGNLKAATQGESDEPWKYPPLVHATLEHASVRHGSLVYAAAEEKLAKTQEPSLVATMSDVAGLCHLAAIIGGAAPPVAATLEIVAALLGGMQAASDAWKSWRDTLAARSSLDPAQSIGAEPSYSMTVLSLLSVVPDLPLLGRGLGRAAAALP